MSLTIIIYDPNMLLALSIDVGLWLFNSWLVALTPMAITRKLTLISNACQEFVLKLSLVKEKEVRRRERRRGIPIEEVRD